jgi:transposase
MRTYSLDLRERVVGAVEKGGLTQKQISELFNVSVTWIKKLLRRKRLEGHILPLPHGGGKPALLDERKMESLRRVVARMPDATLEELCQKVPGPKGKPVSLPTMSRALAKLGLTKKKESALGLREGRNQRGVVLGTGGGAAAQRLSAHLSR